MLHKKLFILLSLFQILMLVKESVETPKLEPQHFVLFAKMFVAAIIVLGGALLLIHSSNIKVIPETQQYFFATQIKPENGTFIENFHILYDFDKQEGVTSFDVYSNGSLEEVEFMTYQYFSVYEATIRWRGNNSHFLRVSQKESSWSLRLLNLSSIPSAARVYIYFKGNTSNKTITPSGRYLITVWPVPDSLSDGTLFVAESDRFVCSEFCFFHSFGELGLNTLGSTKIVQLLMNQKPELRGSYYFDLNFKDAEAERNKTLSTSGGISFLIAGMIFFFNASFDLFVEARKSKRK